MMLIVLVHLAEVGSAESGEVADSLGFNRKYISVVLSRCSRRRFVSRTAYRRGRERGYIYKLNEKGAQWILHKSSPKETVPDVRPKPEKEFVKVLVPVIVERPKSLFDEPLFRLLMDSYNLRMTQDGLQSKSCGPTVPSMYALKMRAERRQEESEAGFLLYMSEKKRRMEDEELLAKVAKGHQECFNDLLRFVVSTRARSTGAVVSERGRLLRARLEAGMTGPKSGIREISSWPESSKAEVAKKEPVPNVSSEDSDLNQWWNSLPTVPLKLPRSLFPGNNPNVLQAAVDAGFPAAASTKKPAEPSHWQFNVGFSPDVPSKGWL
jgi:DNA-binding MarR family transcriptional regulator